MNTNPVIPRENQLQALANGLSAFYRLIEDYTGGSIKTDFRHFATVSKSDLADYFRNNQELAAARVMSVEDALKLHDHPVLLAEDGKWLVCWIDKGDKKNQMFYTDLSEAAANFVMAYW